MQVITCFSYKGGAGRTVAAANIAAALASKKDNVGAIKKSLNKKVALFDLDVFSAGLHRVLGIENSKIKNYQCIQDYLLRQISPEEYYNKWKITLTHDYMETLRFDHNVSIEKCREDFTLFPAKPEPDRRFTVQKHHHNLLIELIVELENRGYDYVIIDGESGTRSMADISIRLSDIILMFFRLTWQHVDGTMKIANSYKEKVEDKAYYLIPTVVPLIGEDDVIYQKNAPGLQQLREMTSSIPRISGLNDFASANKYLDETKNIPGPGHFLSTSDQTCIHESLVLKGDDRVFLYEADAADDQTAIDYYNIANQLCALHPVGE